jgi:hypothetical protein
MTPQDVGSAPGQRLIQELFVAALLEDLDAGEAGCSLLELLNTEPAGAPVLADLEPDGRIGPRQDLVGQS